MVVDVLADAEAEGDDVNLSPATLLNNNNDVTNDASAREVSDVG